ncbi:MAG TPA: amidohydrolase family protein [Bacteroidota bacterium]|nr:amidohydrolase family protein [Bacteroidota bacterium]
MEVFDHHVHVLSPALVERLKSLSVPFSKPDYAYSDIDSILKFNPADGMFLLSMAYLYGSPEFADSSERVNVKTENDFVAGLARKHPGKLFAFCGVNPLRDYAAGELLRCRRDLGMYGLKLHFASSGVSLKNPAHLARVRDILSVAAGEGMPVVLHFDNGNETFDAADADFLIDSVLAPGPAMELYLAHLGTSEGYTYMTRILLRRFTDAMKNLSALGKHRVYFDISAVGLTEGSEQSPPLTPEDFADLSGQLTELGLERVVFGTDYPVFNAAAYLTALESNMTLTRRELIGIVWNGIPTMGVTIRHPGY